jgi:hypothetical protein
MSASGESKRFGATSGGNITLLTAKGYPVFGTAISQASFDWDRDQVTRCQMARG